ncbi:TetR family transcriptional regulator [Nocardia sp. SYP-A9097]|uniref:TetR family transcriptional regulator n=1 Tax=Nocardia sp. SYP-A9097 TaxID=2663237 RepID=UPI00129A78D5|nr:TetR family transcriptional regulator [Nocardia sp. SYP-A9097]MRH86464.1 TetR family transcriptional regulator [Nocardia sp. SYP-A9097]
MTDDSRTRILRTALELFADRGYYAVSVREIAEQVGLTKTAVLYHFSNKSDIVAALVEPLLVETEAALATVREIEDPDSARWAVVESLIDIWLTHRQLLRMHMQDQALSANPATFARLRDIALSAQQLLAGPEPGLADRVRAAQIYAALSDPVVVFADQPVTELRAAIIEGAQRLLDSPRPPHCLEFPRPQRNSTADSAGSTTPARRVSRGRPATVTAELMESARRLRDSDGRSINEIAAELGISRATLYRHLNAPKTGDHP